MYRVLTCLATWSLARIRATVGQPLIGFAFGMLGIIWLATWLLIETEHRSLRRDSQFEAANLAVVLAQNVARSISDIDRLMLFLREAHERSEFRADWSGLIKSRYTAADETLQIAITNAEGRLIASNIAALTGKTIDLSDREHVRVHMRGSRDELFISKPVLGRVSGKWSVQLTRRYFGPDSRMAGVIVVSLDPDHLSRAYGSVDLGSGSGLAVVGTDDVVRAGTGPFAAMLGRALTQSAFSGNPQPSHGGTTILSETYNGVLHILATRSVTDFPLFVMVRGRDLSQDADWRLKKSNYVLIAAGLSLVTLLAMVSAIRFRRHHEDQISHLVRHDALTGLGNRAMFREQLDACCASGSAFALHLLDLDRFKFVNDTYGHPVGDKVLKAVADRLRANLRQSDPVARLGGDEFAVVQTGLRDVSDASAIAERLVRRLQEPYEIDGIRIEIGASVGVALAGTDARNPADLVKAADLALYTAKADGRSCHRFFNESMDAAARARRELEAGLKVAIEQEQFVLYYQPIVDLESRATTGFEALLRWRHPERGFIPPLEFIPVAEETGLIIRIGTWVLRQACMVMAEQPEHLKIAVNLSPVQFMDPQLIATVRDALSESGLDARRLEIEITESTLMRRDSLTINHLDGLRALGIQILMDDFGTGYSSLSYLQSYPISGIKIDRSFVSTLGGQKSAAAIIKAIVSLADSLGMCTIAEGVETQAQVEELRRLGCHEAQGYYFSAPTRAEDILPNPGSSSRQLDRHAA